MCTDFPWGQYNTPLFLRQSQYNLSWQHFTFYSSFPYSQSAPFISQKCQIRFFRLYEPFSADCNLRPVIHQNTLRTKGANAAHIYKIRFMRLDKLQLFAQKTDAFLKRAAITHTCHMLAVFQNINSAAGDVFHIHNISCINVH